MKPGRKLFLLLLALFLGLGLSGGLLRAFGMPAALTPIDWPVEGQKPGQATLVGRSPDSYFGSNLAVGDVNGDGVEELIASAIYEGVPGQNDGAVYVIPGPLAFNHTYTMPHPAALTIQGTTNSYLGAYLDSGDMNGDGFDDIAMATFGDEIYVYFGSAAVQSSAPMTVPISSASIILTAATYHGQVGFCDLNGDRYQDLFIDHYSEFDPGFQVLGVLGRPVVTSTLPLHFDLPVDADIIIGEFTDWSAWGTQHQMACGDFDGDGTPDLAIGAPYEDPQGRYEAGSVYLIPGDPELAVGTQLTLTMPAQAGLILDGLDGIEVAEGGDRLGSSLAAADFDLDGKDDLVIGAPGGWGVNNWYGLAGEVYLWLGRAFTGQRLPISAQATWAVYGENIYDYLGNALATGDFDSDGAPEVLVGCPRCDTKLEPHSNWGKGYALEPLDFSGVLRIDQVAQVRMLPYAYSTGLGSAVESLDLNHDGFSDLLISAPSMYDPEDDFHGTIYAVSYPIRTRVFLPFVRN